jgi:hypothetical protein
MGDSPLTNKRRKLVLNPPAKTIILITQVALVSACGPAATAIPPTATITPPLPTPTPRPQPAVDTGERILRSAGRDGVVLAADRQKGD